MKYFIDTEFLEGTQDKIMLGIKYGETKPTIDLISIGIISEDGREYYEVSKDFNLKEAWNRYDIIKGDSTMVNSIGDNQYKVKNYWIRENVLKPIFLELAVCNNNEFVGYLMTYKLLKKLINKYGKTNKQIADEVKDFCLDNIQVYKSPDGKYIGGIDPYKGTPEFYAYYADYDWVVFCWLFGTMNELPTGFPNYCIDLKQMLDEKQEKRFGLTMFKGNLANDIKKLPNYPKQTNEHNALSDAKWNFELYKFLQKL